MTRIDGIPTPLGDAHHQRGHEQHDGPQGDVGLYDANVPDSLFDEKGLRTVADADYWKTKPAKSGN